MAPSTIAKIEVSQRYPFACAFRRLTAACHTGPADLPRAAPVALRARRSLRRHRRLGRGYARGAHRGRRGRARRPAALRRRASGPHPGRLADRRARPLLRRRARADGA